MKRKTGFTLIELLVVIAIIAVLMSILMPALQRVRHQAKVVMCGSRLHQWGLFFIMYTDDNGGNFNPGWDIGESACWPVALKPYYKDSYDLLVCPLATKLMSVHGWGIFASWERDFDTPDGRGLEVISSWDINSWTNKMTDDRGDRKEKWFWKNTITFKGHSNVPVLGDGTWNDAWPRHTDVPPSSDGLQGGAGSFGTGDEMQHFCINRHKNGSIHILFADWSVRKVPLKELWRLKWNRDFDTSTVVAWPDWMQHFKD